MAGQKKDSSTSILRRAIDHTPLHPARLETFRPQALNPAQFVARYFNREGGIVQRLLEIGGDFSPIRRAIGRGIVNRFTEFNQSFGPIQRALRPQPEHQPRRRPQVEAGEDFGSYEPEDSGYYPEPTFFEQPLASQYSQNEYSYREPATAPWESPLNSTSLPVARRIEFQPANLSYLTNPVQTVARQALSPAPNIAPDNFRATRPLEQPFAPSGESQVARNIPVVSTGVSRQIPQEVRPVERLSQPDAAQPAPSTFAQPAAPVNPPFSVGNQPDTGAIQPGFDAGLAASPAPLSPVSPGEAGVPGITPEYRTEAGLLDSGEAAYSPVYRPQAQPALNRALQRTFDPAAPYTDGFNTTINQGSNLGASPSAVVRHFAVPATIARYRAVKQMTDKVFLGEQPAGQAVQTPAFEFQPLAPVYSPAPVQRTILETTLAQEAATQQAATELQEIRRVREETRTLRDTQQNAIPANQPLFAEPTRTQSQQVQPLPQQQTNLDAAQPASNVELLSAQAESTQPDRVQRTTETRQNQGQPIEPGQPLAAASVAQGNERIATNQAVRIPGETALQRINQPESARPLRNSGLNRSENAPGLFGAGIPASLLENTSTIRPDTLEVQRLTGNRLASPVVTSGWANSLAALHNNPGVEARTLVARQLGGPETEDAAAATAWTDTGAGVYYDQRRGRRNEVASSAFEAAVETQDRIFSLAETPAALNNFQPQLMQGLTAEMGAPVQPTVNRRLLTTPEIAQSPVFTRPNASEPAIGVNREVISPNAPGVNRVLEVGSPDSANTSEQPLTAPAQAQSETISAENRAYLPEEAVTAEGTAISAQEPAANGQIASPESATRSLSNQAQVFQAAIQPEIYGEAAEEGVQSTGVQRIYNVTGLQPTALQRVFKRLDLDEPGSATFSENTGFDFANLPMSYAARPGSRSQRASQQDNQYAFEEASQQGYFEGAYRQPTFAEPSSREAAIESPVKPGEPSVARTQAGPEAVVPAPEIARETARRPVSQDFENTPASVNDDYGFTTQPGQPVYSLDTPGIQRTVSPVSGEATRSEQSRYFANSLESAWLSPENRLIIERLPGGSSALQRLMQAPGLLQSFLDQPEGASVANLNLPSLRNNPGLTASVVRALEDGNVSGSASTDGWSDSPVLNFVQRRRVSRQVQDSFGDFDSGAVQRETYSFEQPLPNPNDISFASLVQPGQAQPEISRSVTLNNQLAPAQPAIPAQGQRTFTAQASNFQNIANRETTARLQQSIPNAPGQTAPGAGTFTISGDWITQLQRRYEGFSVGQLNDSTGQVMRFLNNDGANFAGYRVEQNYGATADFNYAVPPLLWRKVGDYSPRGGLPANPDLVGGGQPGFPYTTPGEVLRAFEQGETFPGLPDEGATQAVSGDTSVTRQDNSARLDLPRLQQTHQLLQRITNLEKTNTTLELSHRMDAAAQATNREFNQAQPGATPLSMPFAIQRQPEVAVRPANRVDSRADTLEGNLFAGQLENRPASRIDRLIETGFDNDGDAVEAFASPLPPAPLRMTGVPVNRPGADDRSLAVDAEMFLDDGYARPAPEIRTIEVHVPDRQAYGTQLETAAARNGTNGPNIGQGEILQPLAIQRKASVNGQSQATFAPLAQPTLHNIIKTSVGRTLDHSIQRKMTDIFGTHFQDVRVHTGEEAAQATRHVGAEAFTLGSDIYFAPGRYQPHDQAGQALIGHELTHVVQQSSLPSLGNGRVPETSSLGQSLEHHAIANEHLLLRHLSNNQDDHDHYHGFSSDDSGRLSFQDNHFSASNSGGTATVERSYQPVSQQNNNPPIKPNHIRSINTGSGSEIQRAIPGEVDSGVGGSVSVDDIIRDQEGMDKLARKVYQIMRDELMIERERGFGPGNGKFF